MTLGLRRHLRVFQIRLIEVFQFRLRSLMWLFVGGINTVILLLFWWATLSAGQPTNPALTIPAITTYYLLMTTLATTTICHIEEDIAYRDIYKGLIYGPLLRPYPYLLGKFQEEIVWRLLEGFWAIIILAFILLTGFQLQLTDSPTRWVLTIISALLSTLVSFFMKSILGLLAI